MSKSSAVPEVKIVLVSRKTGFDVELPEITEANANEVATMLMMMLLPAFAIKFKGLIRKRAMESDNMIFQGIASLLDEVLKRPVVPVSDMFVVNGIKPGPLGLKEDDDEEI